MTQQTTEKAEIGVIGGSGFYKFLENVKAVDLKTPYGNPSGKITLGEYKGKRIAFLPRHGEKHQFPPHKIPYLANIFALKELGVKQIIAPSAVGSLKKEFKPGEFVICDQFINMTHGRPDTYYSGPNVIHISTAEPYCPALRKIASAACRKENLPFYDRGTVVVVEGPRFSTKAESKWFAESGAEIINMTQYPEVTLARELEMCYLNISVVTDYDAGLKDDKSIGPVSTKEIIEMFTKNIQSLQKLILNIINNIPDERRCSCGRALKEAAI